MNNKGLGSPPPRRIEAEQSSRNVECKPVKFANLAEGDKVQFNKRVSRSVADGYELLAIKTRLKVPDLLGEALYLLQDKYGKV